MQYYCYELWFFVVFSIFVNGFEYAEIPTISVRSFHSGSNDERFEIISKFDEGFNKWGAVRIVDYNIPNLFDGVGKFFHQNISYKMKYNSGVFLDPGFVPRYSEARYNISESNDNTNNQIIMVPAESFDILSVWNDSIAMQSGHPFIPTIDNLPPEISGDFATYYSNLRYLLKDVHLIASKALFGYNTTVNIFERKMNQHAEFACLMMYYFELDEHDYFYVNNETDVKYYMRIPVHSDGGIFNFIQSDNVQGLQIYNKNDNKWYSLKQIQNSIIMLGGDFIRLFTNEYWKAPLHRVWTETPQERFTLTTYSTTDMNEIIDILPNCTKCLTNNQKRKFQPILAAEWIKQKEAGIKCKKSVDENGNINMDTCYLD